ncbi:MAG: hypothetical protein WCL39_10505 [Armatimonadota bacterium]
MKIFRILSVCSLLWLPGICTAQDAEAKSDPIPKANPPVSAVDPYVAASQKTSLQLYQPSEIPDGFVLGELQLVTDPDTMIMATYYNSDGRRIIIMQSSPEGLECPDCSTVDVDGVSSPYETIKQDDGMTLTNLTVTLGKTAVVVGLLRKTGGSVNDALLSVRPVAESLQKVGAGARSKPVNDASQGLKDTARQAGFPVYIPKHLPAFFYLKTAAYTPSGLASDGTMGTPEQLVITYAAGQKEIHLALQPPGAFDLKDVGGRSAKILSWPASITTREGEVSIALDLGKSMALISGNVSVTALVAVAKSLQSFEEKM